MSKNDRLNDTALRMALQREQSRIKMPEGMSGRLMAAVREQAQATRPSTAKSKHQLIARWWQMVAAVAVIAVVIMLVPRLTKRQGMELYEGSFVKVEGQRQDDLQAIRADIREALAMADIAEAAVPKADVVQEAEREILQAADDAELHDLLEKMLNE
ncbi:MAG: hypothetical protein IJJ94_09125 [Bacteroidaceae bacterium]|nr:hypothetical protein [Bacteroidaceae bacterium]